MSITEDMDSFHWFLRKKKWSFEEIIKFILTMEGKSLKMDTIIQPAREENENRARCDLIDHYKGISAIFIADRGYENCNIIVHAVESKMYYLTRFFHE